MCFFICVLFSIVARKHHISKEKTLLLVARFGLMLCYSMQNWLIETICHFVLKFKDPCYFQPDPGTLNRGCNLAP